MFGRALNTRLSKHKNARMTLTEILHVASVLTLDIFSTLTQSLTRVSFIPPENIRKPLAKGRNIIAVITSKSCTYLYLFLAPSEANL